MEWNFVVKTSNFNRKHNSQRKNVHDQENNKPGVSRVCDIIVSTNNKIL